MNDLEMKTYALQIAATRTHTDILKEAQRIYDWLNPKELCVKIPPYTGMKAQAGGAILGEQAYHYGPKNTLG